MSVNWLERLSRPPVLTVYSMCHVLHIVTVWELRGNVCSGREKQPENFQSHGLASLFWCNHPSVLLQGFSVPFPSITRPDHMVQHSFIFLSSQSSAPLKKESTSMLLLCTGTHFVRSKYETTAVLSVPQLSKGQTSENKDSMDIKAHHRLLKFGKLGRL